MPDVESGEVGASPSAPSRLLPLTRRGEVSNPSNPDTVPESSGPLLMSAETDLLPGPSAAPLIDAETDLLPEPSTAPLIGAETDLLPEPSAAPLIGAETDLLPEPSAAPLIGAKTDLLPEPSAAALIGAGADLLPEPSAAPLTADPLPESAPPLPISANFDASIGADVDPLLEPSAASLISTHADPLPESAPPLPIDVNYTLLESSAPPKTRAEPLSELVLDLTDTDTDISPSPQSVALGNLPCAGATDPADPLPESWKAPKSRAEPQFGLAGPSTSASHPESTAPLPVSEASEEASYRSPVSQISLIPLFQGRRMDFLGLAGQARPSKSRRRHPLHSAASFPIVPAWSGPSEPAGHDEDGKSNYIPLRPAMLHKKGFVIGAILVMIASLDNVFAALREQPGEGSSSHCDPISNTFTIMD
ncbi:hypothetical protein DFP72DRAFT_1065934 [Ephemerocybe angulata]|nr:hypothetical protein DFP72DRAFT_1065934 [Tulosesus angulatus]